MMMSISESSENIEVSNPAKSKKKLILISLIVLLLAVGGYFGFIMFTGDSSHEEPIEEMKFMQSILMMNHIMK